MLLPHNLSFSSFHARDKQTLSFPKLFRRHTIAGEVRMQRRNELTEVYDHLIFQQEQICNLALRIDAINKELRTKHPQIPAFSSRELSRLLEATKRLERSRARVASSQPRGLQRITAIIGRKLA
jgi:hypothetical protein